MHMRMVPSHSQPAAAAPSSGAPFAARNLARKSPKFAPGVESRWFCAAAALPAETIDDTKAGMVAVILPYREVNR